MGRNLQVIDAVDDDYQVRVFLYFVLKDVCQLDVVEGRLVFPDLQPLGPSGL